MLPGSASVVSGGVTSTVQEIGVADVSTLPAGSTAWIRSVRVPSPRPLYWTGEVHGAADAPLSEHRKLADGSLELNSNLAAGEFVSAGGWLETVVAGGV